MFARLLRLLAGALCHHPRWFVYPQFALFGLCVYFTAFSPHHLQLDMSRDDLVGSDKSYHQKFMEYRKELDFSKVLEELSNFDGKGSGRIKRL